MEVEAPGSSIGSSGMIPHECRSFMPLAMLETVWTAPFWVISKVDGWRYLQVSFWLLRALVTVFNCLLIWRVCCDKSA